MEIIYVSKIVCRKTRKHVDIKLSIFLNQENDTCHLSQWAIVQKHRCREWDCGTKNITRKAADNRGAQKERRGQVAVNNWWKEDWKTSVRQNRNGCREKIENEENEKKNIRSDIGAIKRMQWWDNIFSKRF